MKLEHNWTHKTLEALEKHYWPAIDPAQESHLVQTVNALRKKQLKDFTTEDLRIMIGQNEGLKFLIPLAIEALQQNILAEGDYYEGDLLHSVLTSDSRYWKKEKHNWETIRDLFVNNAELLKTSDTLKEIKQGWFSAFEAFQKIHP